LFAQEAILKGVKVKTTICSLFLFFIILVSATDAADDWTQKSPNPKPSPRGNHRMAYIGGDEVLLFGGADQSDDTLDDTWVYDLSDNTWAQDGNTSQPSGRKNYSLSETSMDGSSYLVLFGGTDDETWTFGGGDYPLLVELSSFTATASDGKVTLYWRTEVELDNAGFSIYRSEEKDGNYTKIGFVHATEDSEMTNDYQFMDSGVEAGKNYFYYLEDIDLAGERSKSEIIKVVIPPAQPVLPIPGEFRLLQNYPNPFNPETWLPFQLAKDAPVAILIFNLKGQLIRTINLGQKNAGFYMTKDKAAYWDGKDSSGEKVASGVYYYTLQAGKFLATRKMVITKD